MLCVQWVIGHLFLFLLSKISISTLENIIFLFLFLLSKLEIRISNFSFYSRNSRSEFHISLSTLEIRDQNLVFLFLLSKFETRNSNFSFYSRNSRSEFQISLSTLEFTFLTLSDPEEELRSVFNGKVARNNGLKNDFFSIFSSPLETRDQDFKFLFLLSKFEIRISNFSFYSRNSRSEFQISLSTLEIRDQNFKFLFLLSNLLF